MKFQPPRWPRYRGGLDKFSLFGGSFTRPWWLPPHMGDYGPGPDHETLTKEEIIDKIVECGKYLDRQDENTNKCHCCGKPREWGFVRGLGGRLVCFNEKCRMNGVVTFDGA